MVSTETSIYLESTWWTCRYTTNCPQIYNPYPWLPNWCTVVLDPRGRSDHGSRRVPGDYSYVPSSALHHWRCHTPDRQQPVRLHHAYTLFAWHSLLLWHRQGDRGASDTRQRRLSRSKFVPFTSLGVNTKRKRPFFELKKQQFLWCFLVEEKVFLEDQFLLHLLAAGTICALHWEHLKIDDKRITGVIDTLEYMLTLRRLMRYWKAESRLKKLNLH